MKVIMADDHALIREGLERSLMQLESDVEVFHAEDRDSVLEQLKNQNNIDVLLLDLFMPGANGFELLSTICNSYSHIPVIVISGAEESRNMRKAIDSGASGFIPKSATKEVMLSAIKLVCSGGVYIPPDMLKSKVRTKDIAFGENNNTFSLINETKNAAKKLTKRQTEVLDLMSRGMSNKEIARAYQLSENTVKIHVTAILKLFNAENRTEVVVMAHNAEIIEP